MTRNNKEEEQQLVVHGDTDTAASEVGAMGSNVSRHSGKGMSGRRTQSSGEIIISLKRTLYSNLIEMPLILFPISRGKIQFKYILCCRNSLSALCPMDNHIFSLQSRNSCLLPFKYIAQKISSAVVSNANRSPSIIRTNDTTTPADYYP